MTTGPDTFAVKFARFLKQLDDEHSVSLSEEMLRDVNVILNWAHETTVRNERVRQEAARKQQAIDDLLDSDVPVAPGQQTCEARFVRRGSFASRPCGKRATVVRTFTRYNTTQPEQVFLCGTHRKVKGEYGFPW